MAAEALSAADELAGELIVCAGICQTTKFQIAFVVAYAVFSITPILRQTKPSIFGVFKNAALGRRMQHSADKEKGYTRHWRRQLCAVR